MIGFDGTHSRSESVMELRDLRYLLACVEAGSFTVASRRIHAAQPTISHAIKRLESEIGEALLHRPRARNQKVVPTESGRLVVARAKSIIAIADALESELAERDGELRGDVAFGAPPSLAMSLVPGVLADVRARAPGVRLVVDTSGTDLLVERVRAGALDAAVVADVPPRALRGLAVDELGDESFVAIHRGASRRRGGRVTLAELARRPLVLPPEEVFHGKLVRRAFARAGARGVAPVAIIGTAEGLIAAARAGVGWALVPERCVAPGDESLEVLRLRGEPLVRRVRFVAHPDRAPLGAVALIREVVTERARKRRRPKD